MSDHLPGQTLPLALEARHVRKTFRQGPKEVRVLHDVNLELPAGKSLAIVGASGAGKSTLIKVLGGAHLPDGGRIHVQGKDPRISSPVDAQRAGIALFTRSLISCPRCLRERIFFWGRNVPGPG